MQSRTLMFKDPCDALREELLGYGRNLRQLRRVFNNHQCVFACLRAKDHPFVGKAVRHERGGRHLLTRLLTALQSHFANCTENAKSHSGQQFWPNLFLGRRLRGMFFLGTLATGSVCSAIGVIVHFLRFRTVDNISRFQ